MTKPKTRPAVIHQVVLWMLRTLTVVVLSLTVVAVYTIARVGGIENANRAAICDGRALREEFPPETAIEEELLKQAKSNPAICGDTKEERER